MMLMDSSKKPLPRLLPGERITLMQDVDEGAAIEVQPSGLHELYRLARTGDRGQIGDSGPVLASQALEGHYHPAELHKYEAIFGRDSLRVALDLLNSHPNLARATLIKLAELQGVTTNPLREEEPGRIIHEARDSVNDPVAIQITKDWGWDWPYYGSVDSTVEFVRTLVAYCRKTEEGFELLRVEYTGRDNQRHNMAGAMVAAVGWITDHLDSSKEGLLEFRRMNPHGLENQAWKDSWDAYFHKDGSIANHQQGIASIEVQRVTYDALLDAAEFYERYFAKTVEAQELRNRAEKLRLMIMEKFWTEDRGGYFVLGADHSPIGEGALRQLEVRSSNMGHMLHSPVLLSGQEPEIVRRREAIITQLFSPEMLNISGIRTLATDEYRFRPGSYHNGSVWLWDTYFIAEGLDLHGYHGLSYELQRRIMNVIMVTRQYPEFVRGDDNPIPSLNTQVIDVWDEKYQRPNRLEQQPQEVQAWSVAAILSMQNNRKVSSLVATGASERAFEEKILKSLHSLV